MIGLEIAVFAFVTCASPGPVNILASISGAQNGLKANLPFVLGATSGLSLVIIVAGFGVSQLLKSNAMLANILTLIGSVYMMYLAFKLAKASVNIEATDNGSQIPSFYQGAFLQVINPKAWLVTMAGTAIYLNSDDYLKLLILYVLVFFIVCFIAVLLWVFIGSLVATKLKTSHLTLFNRSMAVLLFGLVLYNLFDTFSPYLTTI